LLKRRNLVDTIAIIELVGTTALFVAFAATMAWAEVVFRRLTAARAPAETSIWRKRRPF
jgi:hypothetical protein